jgi:hypothetical protein
MRNKYFKFVVFALIIAFLLTSFTSVSFANDSVLSPHDPVVPIGEPGSYWVTRTASNSNSTVALYLILKAQYSMWTDRTLYGEADYAVTVKKYPNYYVLAYSSFTYGTVYFWDEFWGLMTQNQPTTFRFWEGCSGNPYGTIGAYLSAAGIYVTLSL